MYLYIYIYIIHTLSNSHNCGGTTRMLLHPLEAQAFWLHCSIVLRPWWWDSAWPLAIVLSYNYNAPHTISAFHLHCRIITCKDHNRIITIPIGSYDHTIPSAKWSCYSEAWCSPLSPICQFVKFPLCPHHPENVPAAPSPSNIQQQQHPTSNIRHQHQYPTSTRVN